MQIAHRLREWRQRRGISQTQAAEELGCSQPTVSSWESGKLLPDAINLKRIGQVLGVTVDDLLTDTPALDHDGFAEGTG